MSPPHFPITPGELRGNWTFGMLEPGQLKAEGFTVEAREVPHKGGRTFGYRVSDGQSVITYIPDHCPTAFGPGPEGWGEYHPAALDLAAGSDLLIHDAFLLPEEVAAEASFGHAAADYAVGLGERAGPGGSCCSTTSRAGPTRSSTCWARGSAPGRRSSPPSSWPPRAGYWIYERAPYAVEADARWVAQRASAPPTRSSSAPGRTGWRRR